MTKEMICIGCPMGCMLTARTEESGGITVSGNVCAVGERYARTEMTAPTRHLTGSVRVRGGAMPLLSVKTRAPIPKDRLLCVARALRLVTVDAPVALGDVIIERVADTDADIVATRSVAAL